MSGLDYSQAPIELREQLSFTKTQVGALDRRIREEVEGALGCVLLSTCNRTELYLSCEEGAELLPGELLCGAVGADYGLFEEAFVTRRGRVAVRHLMEVAGGLKSQIWGEDQIVSQVKGAIAAAREAEAADPVLETLFRNAIAAGKEIKTKVRLTNVAASAAERAVQVLERDMGRLSGRRALVIGNGEMGRLAAGLLRQAGCAVTVTLRTYRHGETVVPAGCAVVPYEARFTAMEGADIVLSATTSPHYTVTVEQLRRVARPPARVVDLAMPRDVDPAAGELPGVTLYNVDALGAEQHRGQVPQAVRDILSDHMERFYGWERYRRCLPALEALKLAVTERILSYPEVGEEALDREDLAALTAARAVDLVAGALKERFGPDDLERCAEKLRAHTAVKSRERGEQSGKTVSFSHIC